MKKIVILVFLSVGVSAQAQTTKAKSNPVMVDVSTPVNPTIVWLSPEQMQMQTSDPKLVVKAGIKANGKFKSAVLYVNGQEPADSRGFGSTKADGSAFDFLIEKEVVLTAGVNEIKVVAEAETGTLSESRLVTYNVVIARSTRTDYALIIATDEYKEWNKLANPVFDGTAIARELKENYGFEVQLITNPTKEEAIKKIREYSAKNYLPDDQLFIFIAGHGKFDPLVKDGYLVFKDSKRDDETSDSYYPYTSLSVTLNNNPCRHIFLTLDACFGGTFDQAIASRGSEDMDPIYSGKSSAEFIKKKLAHKSRIYLTSGGKVYVQDGRPGKHSPFAYSFIESLRTYGGKLGVITSNEISSTVERGQKEDPKYGWFGDNEPGSEFIFEARSKQ